jgi:purine-binding chemotaxis protein CheW
MTGAATMASTANGNGLSNGADRHTESTNQYVSFWIEGQLLGVPVNLVQEVLNPQKIARTPRARREIAGLLNLRGQIVTAVNLRERMGLAPLADDRQSMNVVVRQGSESFSLLVDEVGDVIDIAGERSSRCRIRSTHAGNQDARRLPPRESLVHHPQRSRDLEVVVN